MFAFLRGGSQDHIGQWDVTVNSLLSAHSRGAPFDIVNPKKKKGRTGLVNIDSIEIV